MWISRSSCYLFKNILRRQPSCFVIWTNLLTPSLFNDVRPKLVSTCNWKVLWIFSIGRQFIIDNNESGLTITKKLKKKGGMMINSFCDENLFPKFLVSANFIEDGGKIGKLKVFLFEWIHPAFVRRVHILNFMTLIIIEFWKGNSVGSFSIKFREVFVFKLLPERILDEGVEGIELVWSSIFWIQFFFSLGFKHLRNWLIFVDLVEAFEI